MSEEFPLCPELREKAKIEAQALMDEFKKKMESLAKEILSQLYCDVAMYGDYYFATIRQTIYEEHREEIIKEVEQDIVKENASLTKQLEWERSLNRSHY